MFICIAYTMSTYGYCRVSSKNQNVNRQLDAMAQAKVERKHIFIEKKSGKDFDRPIYKKMLRKIREGDVLIIMSIDRLGRNYAEIIDQWRIITREKKVKVKVLNMPILSLDTNDDLINTLISEIVLELLSFCAENERSNIRERQREGIDAALKRGVRFGRPKIDRPDGTDTLIEGYLNNTIEAKTAAKLLGISLSTFYRWANEMKKTRIWNNQKLYFLKKREP